MTDNDETRYRKTKIKEESKARHAGNVLKLSSPFVDAWEEALDDYQPPCRKAGLPSPWVDWHSDPEIREDYEGERPTLEQAAKLCEDCPIRAVHLGGNGICFDYANATGQSHGVWGGISREDGTWLTEK